MTTNKWLQDMLSLKDTTDLLRTEISNGGISTSKTDTLSQLVSKVPLLSPIALQDTWQPDELWKFPDPNGTETTKTIREIYDEDTLASSYTYRGIYQIRGDLDTIDLKLCMNQRTNADTFILSDGTTYENITETTLEHTWDKTKDVVDSNGIPMRYVRIYTNTAYNYIISFYCQSVWVIHNLGTQCNIPTTSDIRLFAISMYNNIFIQCIELEDKCEKPFDYFTGYNYSTWHLLGFAKKLVIKNYTSTKSVIVYDHNLKELHFYNISNPSSISGIYGNLDVLKFHNDTYSTTSLELLTYKRSGGNSSNVPVINIAELDLSKFNKLTTLYMPINCFNLNKVYLPPNLENFYTTKTAATRCGGLIEVLDFPETLKTFSNYANTYSHLLCVKTIRFNSIPTTVNWGIIYGLKEFIIPYGWNLTFPSFSYVDLNKNTILSIFENIADLTGSTAKTITLGSANLAKLTDEEKAIATNKNWTLA